VDWVRPSAYTIPTEAPESDGTLEWDSTTIVVVEIEGGGVRGVGYSYTHAAAAMLVHDLLAPLVTGRAVFDVVGSWNAMVQAVRNIGRPGLASMAIAAVDVALWDLKARLLGLPLVQLLGGARERVPVYASGGFTSYSEQRLRHQIEQCVELGIKRFKMKVGREPSTDPARVRVARDALGDAGELYVDANGAYDRQQALALAHRFASAGVSWFEEPVPSDDLSGMRWLRQRLPPGMELASGEYGSDAAYFRQMIEAEAVDVVMPDATRCGGITGFMEVGAFAAALHVPLSAHTAPALHLHPCSAVRGLRHLEWFHDHVRVERLLFEGVVEPERGELRADPGRAGLGLELKKRDAARFAA
jgi:L-alanine-DL-glutamate epimerase-like enolase superfamily enzyme